MAKNRIRDWVEPAHPVLVQRYDDLVEIYRYLKDSLQEKIDAIFDRVSQQIGFVVTTTLPVSVQVAANGKIEKMEFTSKNLQGTVFEKEFSALFKELGGKQPGKITAGSYSIYLLWHDALKLRLKTDWIEPAHFRSPYVTHLQQSAIADAASQLSPGIREPAHWFDAGIALEKEEEILIAAIDEVYTDLALAERIAVARRASMGLAPGIREPAHFRGILEDLIEANAARRLSPGIREPAHFRLENILDREDAAQLLKELSAVLKKYGL